MPALKLMTAGMRCGDRACLTCSTYLMIVISVGVTGAPAPICSFVGLFYRRVVSGEVLVGTDIPAGLGRENCYT